MIQSRKRSAPLPRAFVTISPADCFEAAATITMLFTDPLDTPSAVGAEVELCNGKPKESNRDRSVGWTSPVKWTAYLGIVIRRLLTRQAPSANMRSPQIPGSPGGDLQDRPGYREESFPMDN
jgi:hypothetical protein